MSAAEKPRYRVKARRLGAVVQMSLRPDPDVMDAIHDFATHVEREGAVAIAMVAVCRDGAVATRYERGCHFYSLLGGVDRLRRRMNQEFDAA